MTGLCRDPKGKAPCKTTVTREELERSLRVFFPTASDADRGRAAVQYARSMAFAALAEREGLEKSPELAKLIETEVKIARIRVLATAYLQDLQRQKFTETPEALEKYYTVNSKQFEQARVLRVAVPVTVPIGSGRRLDHAAVRAELEELRKRALAGEDLNQLQQEAYGHLDIKAAPPTVTALTVRRENLQGDEAKVFDLKPGEITEVIDSTAATVFLKLESKETLPPGAVQQEVQSALASERMGEAMKKIAGSVSDTFDLQYLGLESQPDLFALGALPAARHTPSRRTVAGRRTPMPAAAPMAR